MDARKDRIGEHATQHALPCAVTALGPVPQDPLDRADWQRRAASIGAWRELSGHADPADPIGPEPVAASPDLHAAWHQALAALGPADGPDVRGMPDGRLLHLRDTCPVETGWAPPWGGDKLRQVRATAWEARLAGLRAGAEATAARQRGDPGTAVRQQELAASYHVLHQAYRQRETVLATSMADRADWDAATRARRRLAIAGDTELRRRHPGQHYPPLRSAEPAAESQPELTPALAKPLGEMGLRIEDLAATHRRFAARLADRQSLQIPSQDPGFGYLGQAFPLWPGGSKDAILQPPKPEIRPSHTCLNAPQTATLTGKPPTDRCVVPLNAAVSDEPGSWSRASSRRAAADSGISRHVLDHGIRVAADGVQAGVRVVLRDAPVPDLSPAHLVGGVGVAKRADTCLAEVGEREGVVSGHVEVLAGGGCGSSGRGSWPGRFCRGRSC